MEELEERFGANLRLSERERHGVRIEEAELGNRLVGHRFSLVAKVLTGKAVPKDGFIGVFSRLWKGTAEVSIKEIAEKRFLVRFANQRDMGRVLDMEPWTFREALVLLAGVSQGDDVRKIKITTGVFWVQLHGIPPLNMTGAVVKKIGGLVGSVLTVDQFDGEDCVGRFARARVRMDIEQPLMRGAFVDFPEEGSTWVSFCYEYLPEYCFLCGCLGHPSRICVEKDKGVLGTDKGIEALRAYAGMEAVEDICGKPLKSVLRRTHDTWKVAGRGAERERVSAQTSGAQRWGRSNRKESRQGAAFEQSVRIHDQLGASHNTLAETIRKQREEEERRRQVMEQAWDAGLVHQGDEVFTSQHIAVEPVAEVSSTAGSGEIGGCLEGTLGLPVSAEDGCAIDLNVDHSIEATNVPDGNTQWVLSQDSDPFHLGPLIANLQAKSGGNLVGYGKRGREERDEAMVKRHRVTTGVEGKEPSWRGCRSAPQALSTDIFDQEAEPRLDGSPRSQ
ncbi:hypothetical protein CerSpe_201050 [Prunus speciosa]